MTVEDWFRRQHMSPRPFQRQVWRRYAAGEHGLLLAPTGAGKTYALMGAVAGAQPNEPPRGGLQLLWITPLRALAGDIAAALQRMSDGLELGWDVGLRVGDTSQAVKSRQRKRLPEILVTTPESLHIMLAYPGGNKLFERLQCVVADEWHDLLPTKRGVMMQLALAHLATLAPTMRVWGISATIGNPPSAMEALLAAQHGPRGLVHATGSKNITVRTILPPHIDRFPWAGHMGDALLGPVLDIIHHSRSSLIFTNTRNQAETWYRKLLAADTQTLAGRIALHHGSLAADERAWVESALHDGRLLAVICTSSLDLGVDFRPVDTVIQIGSPKGIARFMQRGGRSGHAPGETSQLYFVPTHALELFEAAALSKAVAAHAVEPVCSPHTCLDVLVQWLVTLAVGDGFDAKHLYQEVVKTTAYAGLRQADWRWALQFVSQGGAALKGYEHFRRLQPGKDGIYRASSKDISRRHRQAIGAITASAGIRVQVLRGQVVGTVDESFAGSLQPGQVFWLSGRALQFVRLRDTTVWVRASSVRRGITPAWTGGRMSFSSQLAAELRQEVAASAAPDNPEVRALQPLLRLQRSWSHVPTADELLIEQYDDRTGHHLVAYPFEGRAVHEILAMLWAGRLGTDPNTFSIAVNDYGFELLAAMPVRLEQSTIKRLLNRRHLRRDVEAAIAAGSLPRRQFRAIATIAGLVTKGRPGQPQSTRHLQASSEMIYDVLRRYDPANRLLGQAHDEVMHDTIDFTRLEATLQRLGAARAVVCYPVYPTPFAFPLLAERLRERLSTDTLADRLTRLQAQLERHAGHD